MFFSVGRSTGCVRWAVLCNMAPIPGVLSCLRATLEGWVRWWWGLEAQEGSLGFSLSHWRSLRRGQMWWNNVLLQSIRQWCAGWRRSKRDWGGEANRKAIACGDEGWARVEAERMKRRRVWRWKEKPIGLGDYWNLGWGKQTQRCSPTVRIKRRKRWF